MFLAQEHNKVLSFIQKHAEASGRPLRILDVGSGKGRYLDLLAQQGLKAVGVEVNPSLADVARAKGHKVYSPDQTEFLDSRFDVILMSHIVEHFNPNDLIRFLETYLKLLEGGGILVVATPLLHPGFYDDFDHIKPYQPAGFLMLLVEDNAQLQFRWHGKLSFQDLWYRREPFRLTHFRSRHMSGGISRKILRISDLAFSALYVLSLGLFSRPTGWVGVFRKER